MMLDSEDSGETTEPEYAPEEYTKDPANKRLVIQRNSHSGGFRKVTAQTEWIDMKAG